MSTKAIGELLRLVATGVDVTRILREEAREELETIRKAAKGLGQRLREAPWDQDAWDEGLSLMESIAKEEP